MTHATRFAAVAVLVALVLLNVSCEAQTPEIDALRVRAEAGGAMRGLRLTRVRRVPFAGEAGADVQGHSQCRSYRRRSAERSAVTLHR